MQLVSCAIFRGVLAFFVLIVGPVFTTTEAGELGWVRKIIECEACPGNEAILASLDEPELLVLERVVLAGVPAGIRADYKASLNKAYSEMEAYNIRNSGEGDLVLTRTEYVDYYTNKMEIEYRERAAKALAGRDAARALRVVRQLLSKEKITEEWRARFKLLESELN